MMINVRLSGRERIKQYIRIIFKWLPRENIINSVFSNVI